MLNVPGFAFSLAPRDLHLEFAMQAQQLNLMTEKVIALSAAELEEIVKGRLCGRVAGFQLLVEEAGLVLRGKARSFYIKQLAQQTVMESSTVRILANEIVVAKGELP